MRAAINCIFGLVVVIFLCVEYIPENSSWIKYPDDFGINPLKGGFDGEDADDWNDINCDQAGKTSECETAKHAYTGSFVTGFVFGLLLVFHGGKRAIDSARGTESESKMFYKVMAAFALIMGVLTVILGAVAFAQWNSYTEDQPYLSQKDGQVYVAKDQSYTEMLWLYLTSTLIIPSVWLSVVIVYLIMQRGNSSGIGEDLETLARLL